MGLHICLYRDTGSGIEEFDRQEWDYTRDFGDKQFARRTYDLTRIWHPLNDFRLRDEVLFRPENFEEWRATLKAGTEEGDHYLNLLAIMEADPGVWCFFSW